MGQFSMKIMLLPGSLLSGNQQTGVICFAQGTLILTADGNRPVERLRVGDEVITHDNG